MTKKQALESLVKAVTKKDAGKKQLNAGEARRVCRAFADLLSDSQFAETMMEYNKKLLISQKI